LPNGGVQAPKQNVEERRKKAWLRKIGFVTRLFIYACAFAALYYFMPRSLSEGWITTRPFAELNLGDILGALVWILIGVKLVHALFNPNPRPDFREWLGWVGLCIIGLFVITGIGLYFLLH
jgi:hypothetical protein